MKARPDLRSALLLAFVYGFAVTSCDGRDGKSLDLPATGEARESGSTDSSGEDFSAATSSRSVVDVTMLGAAGNGEADDSIAVQTAIDRVRTTGGGTVYFPPGKYRITRTLEVGAISGVDIKGEGRSSLLLWSFNGDLFRFTGFFREMTVQDLTIVSNTIIEKSRFAFRCMGGSERGLFQNLLLRSEDMVTPIPSGIALGDPADSTMIRDTQMWGLAGTGVEMGRGADVRIAGGRLIGHQPGVANGSKGIHLLGNNGGVHVEGTDVIGLQFGVLTENLEGRGSNRELLLRQATLDSCFWGLAVMDSSYVNVAGLWAASCTHENVYVGFGGPTLVINGGTIFNAGAIGVADSAYGAHGMTVNSGTFILNGVSIRHNYNPSTNPRGRGLFVANVNAVNYTVTGCSIINNGHGITADAGGPGVVIGNVIGTNPLGNTFAPGSIVQSNRTY